MGTTPILSKEFAIIYGGEVIAYATDFSLERNKEIIEILRLGSNWKEKLADLKDWKVSFNALVTRTDNVIPHIWKPLTAYVNGNSVIIGGNAYTANGNTTGENPLTNGGVRWVESIEYASGTTYPLGRLVYRTTAANEKRIYKSLQASNTNHEPTTSPTWWERIETGYEALLTEIRENEIPVKVTIKPNVAGTTYYYGEGILTALSASISVGDKTTFSGTFEGTGILTQGLTT